MILQSRIPCAFGAQAMTLTPRLILLHPARANDAALIAHEQKHAEQMRAAGTLTWWARYLLSRDFRRQQEVEAYRVQIERGASLEGCARNLATLYSLGIDLPTARELLS